MAEKPTANEAQALTEYWDLMRAPVFWGVGVPRGDRRLVLVLPGLFGNDFYLRPLRTWLARIGYQPAMSTINFNAGCSDRLVRQVEQAFAPQLKRHSGDVAIIGHSRGGFYVLGIRTGFRFRKGIGKNHFSGRCRTQVFLLLNLITKKYDTFGADGQMGQRRNAQGLQSRNCYPSTPLTTRPNSSTLRRASWYAIIGVIIP